ncbi:hypothetical protein AU375_01491 [Methylobacterium radiotolerans]|nr:hypothetical protein AU375_01491 [Methylobacterium radiotolerans]
MQSIAVFARAFCARRCAPAGVLVKHFAQLDGECLTPRERHRHIGYEALNIFREATVGCVALRQFTSMREIGAADRFLPRLYVPAPIPRLRRLGRCRVPFGFLSLRRAHARDTVARLRALDRRARRLVDDPARLPRRRFRFHSQPP